jgi:hypothetical protein
VRTGRQWLVFDADFFTNPFTDALLRRFGATGAVVWVAFLCACKRSFTPGEIHFASDAEALWLMRLSDVPLADHSGREWTLDEFWRFTGRMKQTRRTSRGRVTYVRSTHWERWQDDARVLMARERQRRWRATSRDADVTEPRRGATLRVTPETETETEIPPTPTNGVQPNPSKRPSQGAPPPAPRRDAPQKKPNPRAAGTNPRARGSNPRNATAEAGRVPVPDWHPQRDDQPRDPAVAAALRARRDQP